MKDGSFRVLVLSASLSHGHLNKKEPFSNVMSHAGSVPAMTSQNVRCEKDLLIFLYGFVAPEEERQKQRGWQAKETKTSCFLYLVSR